MAYYQTIKFLGIYGPILLLLFFAISFYLHEMTKAVVSYFLGDKNQSKNFTLNIFKYNEPIGFILMCMSGIGWGRSVFINKMFFKNRKKDTLTVHISAIAFSFILGVLSIFLLRFFINGYTWISATLILFGQVNLSIAIFNMIPINPMTSSEILKLNLTPNNQISYINNEKNIQLVFVFLTILGIVPRFVYKIVFFIIGII